MKNNKLYKNDNPTPFARYFC